MELTQRQQRELDYHAEHAQLHRHKYERVDYDLVQSPRRRWWNQAWSMYTALLEQDLRGKRVLVVGCGFGDDCFLLAKAGAEVYGFDLSDDLLQVGRQVAARERLTIDFRALAAEKLDYPDNFFDVVLARDILHHVEIPQCMAEIKRVCKPGAVAVINEVYTHSLADRIRHSWLVRKVLYGLLLKVVYGNDKPYITEDERKMNEADMTHVTAVVHPVKTRYFDLAVNRVLPSHISLLNQLDYLLLNSLPAKLLGGRVLITGTIKSAKTP